MRVVTALALISILTLSCSSREPSAPSSLSSEEVLFSLVSRGELRTVAAEPTPGAVTERFVTPSRDFGSNDGPLPALVLPAPARVEVRLPRDLPSDARLGFAVGVDSSSHSGERALARFELSIDGEPAYSRERPFGAEVRGEERAWQYAEVALEAGGLLVLETSVEPPDRTGVEAAFGLLEVMTTLQAHPAAPDPDHPDVLLILVDTLRADHLGCYGDSRGLTPNLDALADSGTLFEAAHAPSSWTWPSVASLFTGVSPPEHGVRDRSSCYLADHLETIAEDFRDAGYATVGFSTNPLISAKRNFDQGFHEFIERPWDTGAELITDLERALETRAEHRLFCYVHLTDPHAPYAPSMEVAGDLVPPAPEGWRRRAAGLMLQEQAAGEEVDTELLESFMEYSSALYAGEVATVDHAIGEILAMFERRGRMENTLVVVTSDHGEELADHGLAGHGGQLYPETLLVPLIFRGRGVPVGARRKSPVSLDNVRRILTRLVDTAGTSAPPMTDVLVHPPSPLVFATWLGVWPSSDPARLLQVDALFATREGDDWMIWAPRGPGSEDDLLRHLRFDADGTLRPSPSPPEARRIELLKGRIGSWLDAGRERCPAPVAGGEDVDRLLRGLGYTR